MSFRQAVNEKINNVLEKPAKRLGLSILELKAAITLPLVFLVCVVIADYLARAIGLPGPEETLALIENLFITHGYSIVLLSAFVEGLLLVGLYVPGSVALVLSAIVSSQGHMNIWIVIGLITAGFLVAVIINYLLGRYGWYHALVKFGLQSSLDKMRARAEQKGIKIIYYTYFNPNLASLSATSLGILRMNFRNFFQHSVLAFCIWNTAWSLTFYFLGDYARKLLNYPALITAVIILIIGRIIYTKWIKRKELAK